jgi:RHS repeat-associated protein
MNSISALHFTGAHWDRVLPAYVLGNGYRSYLPSLMRFSAPDLLSPFDAGGIHPYVYCGDDPVNRQDPSGRFPSPAAMVEASGAKTIDAIAARLARHAAEHNDIEHPDATLEPADRTHAEASGPSHQSTRGRKRKADRPVRALPEPQAKVPRHEAIAPPAPPTPPAPRSLDDYVSEAKNRVANDRRAVSAYWRQRYPRMSSSALQDVRRLAELETQRMLASDDRVLVPQQRQELAELLGYSSNRYDWLRSRMAGAQRIETSADSSIIRGLLTTLFGQDWTDGYLTEQF